MTNRVYNFFPGPATLPLSVLKEIQDGLLDFQGTGMSVMEISHRSKEFEAVVTEAESLMKELLNIPDTYRILFLQGGASSQFSMIPMNFLPEGSTADYIVTGSFAEKALEEAVKIGNTHIAATSKDTNYDYIPDLNRIELSSNPAYVHITSNNTIFGTQWAKLPNFGDAPIMADMSSDILSRPFDVKPFGLIYAGAQKNLGPSGVTVVIIREDLLARVPKTLPSMLRYDIHAKNNSLYNTPPSLSIYAVMLVMRWLKGLGGLAVMEKMNQEKAALVYDAIDNSNGFYRGHAQKGSRSLMNVTFRLPSEELEKKFASEATQAGLVGVKGHRSVGGMRTSIYNAMPREGCQALADFMKEFQRVNG